MVNILHQEFSLQMAVDFHSRHFQDKDGAEENGKGPKLKLMFLKHYFLDPYTDDCCCSGCGCALRAAALPDHDPSLLPHRVTLG